MKKNLGVIFKVLLLVMIVFSVAGCEEMLDELFSTITLKATNYNSWGISVYYRESGNTYWETATTYLGTGKSFIFDLPTPGTYDFMVKDWVASGEYVIDTIIDKDCSFECGEEDYYLSVSSNGTLTVY